MCFSPAEAPMAPVTAFKPPPAPPDLTSEALGVARKAQLQRLLTGQGRRSTFLTGPQGLTSPAPTSRPTLLGG